MRPLDEAETTGVFTKLFKFIGPNLKSLIEAESHEVTTSRRKPLPVLFPPPQEPRVLRKRVPGEARHQRLQEEPCLPWDLHREVHKGRELPPDRTGARDHGAPRQEEGMGEADLGDVIPVRKPRAEGGPGEDHRRD